MKVFNIVGKKLMVIRCPGIVYYNDAKSQFWRVFASCLKKKVPQSTTSSEGVLLDELEKLFPQYAAIIAEAFENIDYENCNNESSCALIIKLFLAAGITLEKFNETFTLLYPLP